MMVDWFIRTRLWAISSTTVIVLGAASVWACQDYGNSPVVLDSLSVHGLDGWPGGIHGGADIVLVTMRSRFAVLDRAALPDLQLLATHDFPGEIEASAFNDPYLFVLTYGDPRLIVYDCTDGGAVQVGTLSLPVAARSIAVHWPHLYLADSSGIRVVDVSHPEAPEIVGDAAEPPEPYPGLLAVQGNFLYAATPNLYIYSLADPTSPALVGAIDSIIETVPPTSGLVVSPEMAYITGTFAGMSIEFWGLATVSISDPMHPYLIDEPERYYGSIPSARAVDGQYLYLALARGYDWGGYAGVGVWSVADPTSPALAGELVVQRDDSWALGIVDSTVLFTGIDYPSESCTIYSADVQCRTQGSCDVYPDGGGAYPTIQAALDAVQPGAQINLADGVFTGPGNRDLNYNGKAVVLRSASGVPSACIIDCQGSEADPHRGIQFESVETVGAVLEGVTITNGWASEGGAIRLSNAASPIIRNCRLMDNTAGSGGAVHITDGAAPRFERTLVAGNDASLAGAIHADGATPSFARCTIADNESPVAAIFATASTLALEASIIAFNGPGASILSFDTTADLECCDIHGNPSSDYGDAFEGALGVNGNISVNPLFCMSEPMDYSLVPWSVCLPGSDYNPCGELIGAYAEGTSCDLVGAEGTPALPAVLVLQPNYPNPFNPATAIAFVLPEATTVELAIFDLGGRRVRSLATGVQYAAGSHSLTWDGRNGEGLPMPSGAYLCRLEAGGQAETRKLMLLQ